MPTLPNRINMPLTEKEKQVIIAYRKDSRNFKHSVRILLDLDPPGEPQPEPQPRITLIK